MTHPLEFMIYHLYEWDAARQKYKKKPVGLDGLPLASGGGIPTTPSREAVEATCARLGPQYRAGLWLREGCGMFFLDLDEDAVAGGALTPSATEFAAELVAAGCYFEASSSGRGAHVLGRYTGELPPHSVQRPLDEPAPHALYVGGRGCVLAAPGEPTLGSWDVDATSALLRLLAAKFPPRAQGATVALTAGPRPEWRGPADDDVLIARMLSASGSAAARMGGKLTLAQLWRGECSHDNESDMALAAHLAFWTGADPARIERLMRRSPLAVHRRDKWDSHRTYLQELTITKACTTTLVVYQEPQRVDTLTALLGGSRAPVVGLPPPAAPMGVTDAVVIGGPAGLPAPVDWMTLSDDVIKRINECGTLRSLREEIMPSLSGYGFPSMDQERVAIALNKKLDVFNAKQPLAALRALLRPPVDVTAQMEQAVPEWAQTIVYVNATDNYFDTTTATPYSTMGLRANFSRYMPMQRTGAREDVVQYLQERWNMTTVEDTEYRPDKGSLFDADGRRYANDFRLSSIPTPTFGSNECVQCIEMFKSHLYEVVSRRDGLYYAILGWIAHNVQHPGVKIRWSPLIQGAAGVGKSIFTELFNAGLGRPNVNSTSPATLSNSGGFTDWAVGAVINVIEELKLDSKESRKLYNSMKTYIADDDINVNRKGRVSGRKMVNVTNHWANTNYRGTLPFDAGDRRWCVIFTPWEDADAAARSKGFLRANELTPYFNRIGNSMRGEPGAWRSWLLGIDLSAFDPNSRAPHTEEREAMRNGSGDFIEQEVEDTIARGFTGVSVEVFCSHCLMNALNLDTGDKPDKRSWNRILSDLGYIQHSKTLWWNGKMRRVWSKKPMSEDQLKDSLNKTLQNLPHL